MVVTAAGTYFGYRALRPSWRTVENAPPFDADFRLRLLDKVQPAGRPGKSNESEATAVGQAYRRLASAPLTGAGSGRTTRAASQSSKTLR
jgi:hypothetical protein